MLQTLTESKLFERTAVSLGVHEVDEHELESDPAAVDGEVFPVNGCDGLGVHVNREETS
jgi:hypothetical protein